MRLTLALILLLASLAACTGSRGAACEGYFLSCERNAPRPACQALTPADSTVHAVALDRLVGRVQQDDLAKFMGTHGAPESLAAKAAQADALWYYDASGRMDGGMRIGEEGIIAIQNCTVLAQMTLVIYN